MKNRRKDGTYYWVMANVTPLMEGDQPVGYMSVRTQASRDQIQQAEQLYKTMQAEKQAGVLVHGLRAGRVIKNNLWGRVSGALRMGVFSKMLLGMGVVVAAAMAAAQLGGQGLTLASGPHGWAWWRWRCAIAFTCTRCWCRRCSRCSVG